MQTREELVEKLIGVGVLESEEIIKAFKVVDRKDFVLPEFEGEAYEDHPLPIPGGQTISQPYTVAFMLKLLDPQEGDKILDVGSGSGWTTALLAHIVSRHDKLNNGKSDVRGHEDPQYLGHRTSGDGKVIGVEIQPELVEFGRKNLAKYDFKNAGILKVGEAVGYPKEAPFDKILVSAAAKDLSRELVNQLKIGGVMVIPVQHAVWKINKISKKDLDIQKYEGFSFVPLKQ